jgi:hypothetical protein
VIVCDAPAGTVSQLGLMPVLPLAQDVAESAKIPVAAPLRKTLFTRSIISNNILWRLD